MIDGAKPQPPQTRKPVDFLTWAKKQVALAQEVVSGYEAGPTGFWLHRQLTALGVRNYVVCPPAWTSGTRVSPTTGPMGWSWPPGWIVMLRATAGHWR